MEKMSEIMKVPIFKDFKATTLFKAFILNGLCVAIIATLSVEIRHILEDKRSHEYIFFNKIFGNFTKLRNLTEFQKVFIVFIVTFLFALVAYHVLYLFFGYGGGMINEFSNKKVTYW
jgi:hypothetical protein